MSTIPDVSNTPITPEEVVRILRELRGRIPDFTLLDARDRRAIVSTSSVDPARVHAAINAIGASEPLRNALGSDADDLRQSVELAARWLQVLDEAGAFRAGVENSTKLIRHRVGVKVLKAYQISRQLARYKENAHLLPHIDAMRRASSARRRAPQPEPDPQPPRGNPNR
ncbi:MAG TPA: hypothetical protein VF111_07150 [Thermoanaerobaculia bacterium]